MAAVERAARTRTRDGRQGGLGIAVFSLGLVAFAARDGFTRVRQTHNMAMRDVTAPAFDTADISGQRQRLEEHRGNVVVLNIWATWCLPCRDEMPKLDRLYREHVAEGLLVYGLSDESVATQRKFLQQVRVSYPLLTVGGTIPALYREISVYPATFLIDRQGRLQPGPAPGQPFEKLEAAVQALLKSGS